MSIKFKVGDRVLNFASKQTGTVLSLHTDDKFATIQFDDLDYSTSIDLRWIIPELNQKQTSTRYNEGKTQTREIDPDFILGIGEVLTKSRAKYEHFNWQKPTNFSTPYESLMRHLMAFQKGEETDQETGSHHLLHAATNIMFLHYHAKNNTGIDDRGFKKELTLSEKDDTIDIGCYVQVINQDRIYYNMVGEVINISNGVLLVHFPNTDCRYSFSNEELKKYNN